MVLFNTNVQIMENDLQKRLFDFALRVFRQMRKIPFDRDIQVYKTQLIKASSSVGANYEEAQGGSSTADFHNKINISLREVRESNFFLRLLKEATNTMETKDEFEYLIDESEQLKRILGKISAKTKSKK